MLYYNQLQLLIQSPIFIKRWLSNQVGKEVLILANKMDLRYIKTEKLIEDTYLSLKRKHRRPIRVSELCGAALINKTTFYTHYETMESLHEHICEKEVGQIIESCPNIDAAFSDTDSFVRSFVSAIQSCTPVLDLLFHDDVSGQIKTIESALLKHYLGRGVSPQQEMKMIFAIGGAAKLLIPEQSEERIQLTIQLIDKVIHS